MGKKPFRAAIDASREIGLAVVATAATIIAVFVPVAFMGGVPGQFFRPFGVTIAVSTMFSTLVATTITPMLSAYILKAKKNIEEKSTNSERKKLQPYRSLLTWSLRHKITTIIFAVVFFIGSVQLIPLIPKGLFDGGDSGLSTIAVELPPGSTLKETDEALQQTYKILKDNPVVDTILATGGSENKVNSAFVYVKLVPREERSISQKEFENKMREKLTTIPGVRIAFRSRSGGGSSKDITIILKSGEPQALTQTAKSLEQQMREIPGLVEVTSSVSLVKPEIIIEPDVDRATDLGVSVQSIARTASLALIGDIDANLAKFNLPDRQIPIRVQIDPKYRDDIETLRNLRVPSSSGNLVPITAVANIRLGSGLAEINRFDRNRQVSVEGNLQGISLGQAMTKIRELPAIKSMPPSVSEEPAGDAKIMRDIFTRFGSALGLAILSIYAILVLLYNSFLYPLGILVSLPLSIGGTLFALLITQKELGLFALIGIVLLMGLVTKNAILLVDCALMNMDRGESQFNALVDAGVSRLRPIMMTSVSTIAGMVPIALGLGADGSVRSPMAIAVIGGFTTSTLLTLIVVPVIFSYIDNFLYWITKLLGLIQGNRERGTGNSKGV
jgi:multidrug efflux pump subunit AcrB